MQVQFLNFYLGESNTYGFSFLKAIADEKTQRSFIEVKYDFTNKKWSIELLWYVIL